MLEDRLLYELHLLNEFKESHDYLLDYDIVSDDPLSVIFSILVKGNRYSFLAIFNKYFPKQPIVILKITEFKTCHCYRNGTMCLKWGQDNWDDNLHLTHLIINLYELLFDENPLGEAHGISESGENLSFGQTIRMSSYDMIVVPYNITNLCNKSGVVECIEASYEEHKTFIITKIDGKPIFNSLSKELVLFNYIFSNLTLNDIHSLNEDELISSLKLSKANNYLVFTSDNRAFVLLEGDDFFKEIEYVVNHDEVFKRSGIDRNILNKKITILGLGSVGSRVMCDLARAGFNNFYIVDDDYFMPFNVLRHELTDRHIGMFKVDALKRYVLDEINQDANIEISKLAPTGQESSMSTNNLLKSMEGSSIIIDCTGCDSIYYLVDAYLSKNKAHFLSGTIIPGGLGNLIICRKSDSKLDLESILKSYWQWANSKVIFAEASKDYSATINSQTHVATMSDCSILSGLIGRLCIDILLEKNVDLKEINVFSTSNYADLNCYYRAYNVSASFWEKKKIKYDVNEINDGKKIYEDYCSKRSKDKNTK